MMKMNSYPFLFWTLFFIFFNLTFLPSLSRPLPPPPPSNITLFGDASITPTAISLTKPLSTCPTTDSDEVTVGAAYYSSPVQFLNPITNNCASFLSRFTFLITQSCSSGLGLRMAFVVTSSVDGKRFMGRIHQDSYLAILFESDEGNVSHIGVLKHRIETGKTRPEPVFVALDLELNSGREVTAWVQYRGDQKSFRVWVGYSPQNLPASPALDLEIDLSKSSKGLGHVGFTADQAGSASYLLTHWSFQAFSYRLPSSVPFSFWEHVDCVYCKIQASGHRQQRTTGILIGLISVVLVLLSTLLCLLLSRKRIASPRRRGTMSQVQMI